MRSLRLVALTFSMFTSISEPSSKATATLRATWLQERGRLMNTNLPRDSLKAIRFTASGCGMLPKYQIEFALTSRPIQRDLTCVLFAFASVGVHRTCSCNLVVFWVVDLWLAAFSSLLMISFFFPGCFNFSASSSTSRPYLSLMMNQVTNALARQPIRLSPSLSCPIEPSWSLEMNQS